MKFEQHTFGTLNTEQRSAYYDFMRNVAVDLQRRGEYMTNIAAIVTADDCIDRIVIEAAFFDASFAADNTELFIYENRGLNRYTLDDMTEHDEQMLFN